MKAGGKFDLKKKGAVVSNIYMYSVFNFIKSGIHIGFLFFSYIYIYNLFI
jgi:hypothetical protein